MFIFQGTLNSTLVVIDIPSFELGPAMFDLKRLGDAEFHVAYVTRSVADSLKVITMPSHF